LSTSGGGRAVAIMVATQRIVNQEVDVTATVEAPAARTAEDRAAALTATDLERRLASAPVLEDPAAERQRLSALLAAVADGAREPLEALRFRLLDRMHRPDRSGVAEQLRVVEGALALIPFPVPEPWSRMQRWRSPGGRREAAGPATR
jgi:hypothetical protein